MVKSLRDFRAKLLTIQLLSRQMLGRVDELGYHTEFLEKDDDDSDGMIEYLYKFLEDDYEKLKMVCSDTKLPEKESLRNDT